MSLITLTQSKCFFCHHLYWFAVWELKETKVCINLRVIWHAFGFCHWNIKREIEFLNMRNRNVNAGNKLTLLIHIHCVTKCRCLNQFRDLTYLSAAKVASVWCYIWICFTFRSQCHNLFFMFAKTNSKSKSCPSEKRWFSKGNIGKNWVLKLMFL